MPSQACLEPEWEAKFEPNSYGFRPGRSTHDAIVAIQQSIKHQESTVLDADISKCFDKINHDKLLEKLETFSNLKKQIKSWLKAGVLDKWSFEPTNEGTPQGGIISPLLANIALHGMEEKVKEIMGKGINKRRQLSLIRYADDFVILHKDLEVIIRAKKVISEWLSELNLELKPSKTRISHTLHEFEGNVGFDFLGFNVRQYPVGKHHSGIQKGRGQAKILGFKTLIKPGKNNIKTHVQKCHEVIKKHTSAPQGSLIKHLNPIIKGWCNYYSIGVSNEVFHKLDFITYSQLKRWGERRHPNKGRKWVARKYWHSTKNQNWVFATKEGDKFTSKLYGHQETKIARHVKVAGTRSPFDGDWIYWSSRMGKDPTVKKSTAKLLKKQKGKCNYCEMYFREDDVIEKDHIIPKTLGGKDTYNNIQLLHRHCHDVKTAQDGSACSYKDNTKEKPDEKETLTSGFEDEFVW